MKTLVSTALIGLALVATTAPIALAEDENSIRHEHRQTPARRVHA